MSIFLLCPVNYSILTFLLAVQIDLHESRYINPKISIRFGEEKRESDWFGFRKYNQIRWEPEQTWYLTSLHPSPYSEI